MKTIAIQIGNSDDKLTQADWSEYITHLVSIVQSYRLDVHFMGCSEGHKPWQNACIIAAEREGSGTIDDNLKKKITALRKRYQQDSAAILIGETELI